MRKISWSFNRLKDWEQKFDIGIISASRATQEVDENNEAYDVPMSRDDNNARTKTLHQELQDLGYWTAPVTGRYNEDQPDGSKKIVTEKSWVVADNRGDFDSFKKNLQALAKEWDQDSVLIQPKSNGDTDNTPSFLLYQDGTEEPLGNRIHTINDVQEAADKLAFYTQINGRAFYNGEQGADLVSDTKHTEDIEPEKQQPEQMAEAVKQEHIRFAENQRLESLLII
jgi:hypothetical protein